MIKLVHQHRGKDGNKESVVFAQATPESKLNRRFQKVIQEAGGMIAVVEKRRTSLKLFLQRSDSFKDETCLKEKKCLVSSGKGYDRCRKEGVTYEILCRECGTLWLLIKRRHSNSIRHQSGHLEASQHRPVVNHSTPVTTRSISLDQSTQCWKCATTAAVDASI